MALYFKSTFTPGPRPNRELKVGDKALTDFNEGEKPLRVTIIDVKHCVSQSGVQYRVSPSLRGGDESAWYDADWFDAIKD
jgi:hypothetical protein